MLSFNNYPSKHGHILLKRYNPSFSWAKSCKLAQMGKLLPISNLAHAMQGV